MKMRRVDEGMGGRYEDKKDIERVKNFIYCTSEELAADANYGFNILSSCFYNCDLPIFCVWEGFE